MIILPFTKKAQARDIAIEQLRPLLALQRLPADFWNQAYAVSFLLGYVEGVTKALVGEQRATIDFVSNVQTGVLSALAPQEMELWPHRAARWRGSPETVEGIRNGKFIVMFLHGDSRADATELAAEAFRQARERAPVFDGLKAQTNERGRAAIILCEILFFDKINGSRSTDQRPAEPVKKAEPEAPPAKRPEPPAGATFRIGQMKAEALPPSHANIWLEGDELWLSTPSKDFSFDGRAYHISGGAICFPKHTIGREALLKVLRTERDLWAPGDEAALKARLIQRAEQSQS